ncbi:phosphoglycolate phosphatase [Sphingomonas zeicaulis]|uniref:HAD-IA family hydrolase n=1 Tax=Sphingomonas zeicaulis TaxID=1632740 RepID=UPI003D1C911B
MATFPFAIVGFDLDGTLLDTSADLAAAVNHALALDDRPPLTIDEVKPMIGGGARLMLEKGLQASGGYGPELMTKLYPELLDFYAANISAGTVPFPGLYEALDTLDAMGVKIAVVTNKFERLAVKLIDELGIAHRFATVIGGDTMGPGRAKPDAAPILEMIRRCGGGSAAFVGDSIYDTMAARNAGIPSIAVSFGFLMQPIEELQADAIIDHYDALIPTLERLGSA